MRRCKGVLLAGMLVLSMSVPVYADKSVVVKVEAPADTRYVSSPLPAPSKCHARQSEHFPVSHPDILS